MIGPELRQRLAISRSRMRTELRNRRWQALAAGVVLTRPDEPTREDWADVGVLLAGRGSAVTGWDAVRARGIGDPGPPNRLVTVLSPDITGRVVGGVRIRRTDRPFETTVQPLGAPLEHLPLAALPRAVTDAALDYRTLGPVRALVSAAVQRRHCAVPDLLAEYSAGPRNNSRLLRIALADLLDGARSAAEAAAVRKLGRGGVPAFEVNVSIVDAAGRLLRVVDLFWRALRAVIEIDSRAFHFSEADWQATLARHNELTRHGLALLHYAPRAVTARGSTFVTEVAAWLRVARRRVGRADAGRPRGARRHAGPVPRPRLLLIISGFGSIFDQNPELITRGGWRVRDGCRWTVEREQSRGRGRAPRGRAG